MNEAKYIYEFISPIVVEESFIIEEQDYYVNKISDELFNKIKIVMNDFMNLFGEKGLASLLDNFLKDNIEKIYLYPEIIDNKLYCKTVVVMNTTLVPILKGILLDFIEDEFMSGIGDRLSNIDIICDIEDNNYYNKIHKYLQMYNIPYTVKLNLYDYNNFFIEEYQ